MEQFGGPLRKVQRQNAGRLLVDKAHANSFFRTLAHQVLSSTDLAVHCVSALLGQG